MIEPINNYVVVEPADLDGEVAVEYDKIPLNKSFGKSKVEDGDIQGFLDIPKKPKKASRGLSSDEKFTVKTILAWPTNPDKVGRKCIVEEVMIDSLPTGDFVIKEQYIVGFIPE